MNDQRDDELRARRRENDQTWEDRADRAYTRFTDRPGWTLAKWAGAAIGVIVAIAVLGSVLGFIGSWGGEAKRIASPDNVREQNTQIIDAWESMAAAAENACAARAAAGREDGDPTLVEDPSLAYAATYRRIRAGYNRRMANLYEAQLVRKVPLPSNLRSYPERAPTLEQQLAEMEC